MRRVSLFILVLVLACNLSMLGMGCGGAGGGGDDDTDDDIDTDDDADDDTDYGWVFIPSDTFRMGCVPGDLECENDEKPRHTVTLEGFYMMKTEVTQEQYEEVMGKNPSYRSGCDQCPVEQVSWYDASDFCEAIGGRLPTEAEWEYAARGGVEGEIRYGDLDDTAWWDGNSGDETHPVGQKKPNDYGLYDMLGNVWEWCHDWYDEDYYDSSPQNNPQGPSADGYRVIRGGSWTADPRSLRASNRYWSTPSTGLDGIGSFGFRCVK